MGGDKENQGFKPTELPRVADKTALQNSGQSIKSQRVSGVKMKELKRQKINK